MRTITIKLLLLPILLLIGYSSQASHIMGMNITYKHIGGDTFVIHCDFFRYCGGSAFNSGSTPCWVSAGMPGSAPYYIYCEDNLFKVNRTAYLDTIQEATPICEELDSALNTCGQSFGSNGPCGLLGIQWGLYTDTLVLDSATTNGVECDNWMFVYSSGARNPGTNYTTGSVVAYDRINIGSFPTNSSVQFNSAKPIPFFCDGQEIIYNWSAYDPDGDSLYWELDTAWTSHIISNNTLTSVPYISPYPAQQPMPGTTTINHSTGQLNFVATIPAGYNYANYAIAVTVKEYSKSTGMYKGEVHRDVQFIVLDSCNNKSPLDTTGITGFIGDGDLLDSNTIVVCSSSDSFEFDLIYFDLDTAGNLDTSGTINAYCNISEILPGATWTSSNSNPDTVHIKWVLQNTNQSFVPFNVTVEDDFCPVTGFNVYSYVIKIVPSTFLGPDTSICSLDTITLDAHAGDTFWWEAISGDPIDVGVNFGCELCQKPWIHPNQTTTYVVTSNLDSACGNRDTIVVEVFDKFPLNLGPAHGGTADTMVYCASDGLDTIVSQTPGGKYLGAGIVNNFAGVFAPDVVDPGSGRDTIIQVVYLLEGVCANSDTLSLRVKGAPDAGFDLGPYCKLIDTVTFQGNFEGVPTSQSWWPADSGVNLATTGFFSPKLHASAFGAPDTLFVYHELNDSGCVNIDSGYVRVIDIYDSSIDSLPKICEGEEVEVYLNNFQGDDGGAWKGEGIYQNPVGTPNYYFNPAGLEAGNYNITYKIAGDCESETTEELTIHELPDATIFGADSVYCDNIHDSVLLEAATPSGRWGGSMTSLHDGYFVPNRIGEGVYTISYELYDTLTTCYNKNVVPVRIARTPVQPNLYGGGPYCQGTELNNLRGDGLLSNTYKWYIWDEDDKEAALEEDSNYIPGVEDFVLLGAGNPFNFGELNTLPYEVVYGTQMSKYGCESGWSKLEIAVLPAPIAKFGAKDSIKEAKVPAEITFINQSEIGADSSLRELTYYWTFGPFGESIEENPTFTFNEIGKYVVTLLVDNTVCTDEYQYTIFLDRLVKFFIPNVFTPNGDKHNDVFDWELEGIKSEDFSLKIYNRWGTLVFETEDVNATWDGQDAFLGGDAPDGTYFYIVQGVEDTNEQEKAEYRGDLTLIRE